MHKNLKSILLLSVLLTGSFTIVRLSGQTTKTSSHQEQKTVDENQFPIAEAEALELLEPSQRIKKKNKERKYRKYKDTIGPGVTISVAYYDWPQGFPTLPVKESDAVVIGEVSDAKAFVTSDAATVYSEFTVNVIKVLKNDNQNPLSSDASIIAERPGGRVRYTSGHISRFSIAGWGMPQKNRRYTLFLNRNNEEETYRIVTGYELRGGRVFPLDMTTSSGTDFDAYINGYEAAFLNQLRPAIENPHR